MAFDEIRLPTDIERGASGGPGFLTNINLLVSGKEQRNSLWSVDRGRWDIGFGIQTREDALLVRNFFMARLGRARGFRFRDWANYEAIERMPTTPVADGVRRTFNLIYRYEDAGGFYYDKRIFKPVVAGFRVWINDSEQVSGWTVNPALGVITFSSAPSNGAVVTWMGEFDLPVRFDTDELNVVITTREVISFPSLPIVELKL